MVQKEAKLQDKEELVDLINQTKTEVVLHDSKKVKVGYIKGDTQDKIDYLITKYESFKKSLQTKPVEEGKEPEYTDEALNKGNRYTRRFYSKVAAVILINNYFGIRLFWWLKWRLIYYFSGWTGEDYLKIIVEAKKKAMEREYSVAMALTMDMTTTWTTMTKKEAEEYRHELELAREAQSLKSSQS